MTTRSYDMPKRGRRGAKNQGGRARHLKWPDEGDEKAGGDPQEDVEGEADFDEIGEAVSSGPEDVGVGLIADGGGKGGAGSEHQGDEKGEGRDLEGVGKLHDDGSEDDSDSVVRDEFGKNGGKEIGSAEHSPGAEGTGEVNEGVCKSEGCAGLFHGAAKGEHSDDEEKDFPINGLVGLAGFDAAGEEDKEGGDKGCGEGVE